MISSILISNFSSKISKILRAFLEDFKLLTKAMYLPRFSRFQILFQIRNKHLTGKRTSVKNHREKGNWIDEKKLQGERKLGFPRPEPPQNLFLSSSLPPSPFRPPPFPAIEETLSRSENIPNLYPISKPVIDACFERKEMR